MGPAWTVPSSSITRYFVPRVASAILRLIAKKPKIAIHKAAPGPPSPIATAMPAMLPSPIAPEISVASAWKLLTSPGSVLLA